MPVSGPEQTVSALDDLILSPGEAYPVSLRTNARRNPSKSRQNRQRDTRRKRWRVDLWKEFSENVIPKIPELWPHIICCNYVFGSETVSVEMLI